MKMHNESISIFGKVTCVASFSMWFLNAEKVDFQILIACEMGESNQKLEIGLFIAQKPHENASLFVQEDNYHILYVIFLEMHSTTSLLDAQLVLKMLNTPAMLFSSMYVLFLDLMSTPFAMRVW